MVTKLNEQQKEFAGYLAELLQASPKGEVAETKTAEQHQEAVPQDDEVQVLKKSDFAPAQMEQGLGSLTAGLDRSIPFDIPLASILVGGLGGLVVGDVIDGFAPPRGADGKLNFVNVGVKALAVAAAFHPRLGRRYFGDKPSMVLGVVLAIGLLGDLLPLDQWVAGVTGAVRGALPFKQNPSGLGGNTPARQSPETTSPEMDELKPLLGGR